MEIALMTKSRPYVLWLLTSLMLSLTTLTSSAADWKKVAESARYDAYISPKPLSTYLPNRLTVTYLIDHKAPTIDNKSGKAASSLVGVAEFDCTERLSKESLLIGKSGGMGAGDTTFRRVNIDAMWQKVSAETELASIFSSACEILMATAKNAEIVEAQNTYGQAITQVIVNRRLLRYPSELATQGVSGQATIGLGIGPDGKTREITTIASTSTPELDATARIAVSRATAFVPVPPILAGTSFMARITLKFSAESR